MYHYHPIFRRSINHCLFFFIFILSHRLPIYSTMQLFSPYFYSIFYYDYQVLACTLRGVMQRSFGRKPVRRGEQNKERNASFFFTYIDSFLSLFFRVISFPTKTDDDPNNSSSCRFGNIQRRDARPLSLSLPRLLKNIVNFYENTNDGSQHLRKMLPFFSRIFSYSSCVFGIR